MREGVTYKRLGDLVKIRTGKLDANAADENGQYPFFTCSREPLRINKYSYDCECVLVAGNGDLNVKYYNGKFDAYQRTYIIEKKDDVAEISVPYLYRFFELYVEELRQGSIGGIIKYIKLGNLTEAQIPVPSLSTQELIVRELDSISSVISAKKQQVLELENLAQAIFLDTFGDPITNPKGWEVKKMGEFATEFRYGTSKPASPNGKYKYLRMCNLTYDGYLDLTDVKTIDIPDNEIEKCIVRRGDVLFNRTNSLELIGKTCMFDEEESMVIAGYIIRVRLNDEMLPIYMTKAFNMPSMKKLLKAMAKGAVNQVNINAKELASISIPLPPLSLQQAFAEKVQAIEEQKRLINQSIAEFESLLAQRMEFHFA